MSKTALERELESWGKEVVKNAKKFLKEIWICMLNTRKIEIKNTKFKT